MPRPSLFVVAHAHARAGQESHVRRAFEALVAPTRAEPGCRHYELFENGEQPGDFVFVQEYDDEDAFEAHLASPHVTEMLPDVLPRLATSPDIRRYRRLR